MKKIIKGTGITKKEIGVFETPEEQRDHYREAAETFNGHKNWFERAINANGIETWVKNVTKEYDVKLKEFEKEIINNEPAYEDDSELDFAIQIRSLIKIIRSALEKNDCDEVCRFAMKFGETFTEVRFKFNWEKPALMGESHSNSQSDRAKNPRSRINVDGEKFSIKTIVIELAKMKDEFGFVPTKELWSELFSELDKKHLNPVEKKEEKDSIISYSKDDDENLDEIKFNSFKTMISNARKIS